MAVPHRVQVHRRDREHSVSGRGNPLRRPGRGHGLRAPQTGAGFLHPAHGPPRHARRSPRRLERLPAPGRGGGILLCGLPVLLRLYGPAGVRGLSEGRGVSGVAHPEADGAPQMPERHLLGRGPVHPGLHGDRGGHRPPLRTGGQFVAESPDLGGHQRTGGRDPGGAGPGQRLPAAEHGVRRSPDGPALPRPRL